MKDNIGYKLFEMNENGELLPLFIDKNNPVPIGVWIHAEFIPTKGFAARGGWHVGTICDAPWLKGYDSNDIGCYKSQRSKKWKRVWCEVEYNTNHNYDEEVAQLPKKCFIDKVPDDGYYIFREVGKGDWVITSDIKVVKIISEEERQNILKEAGYDEVAAYAKYKACFEKRMKISA